MSDWRPLTILLFLALSACGGADSDAADAFGRAISEDERARIVIDALTAPGAYVYGEDGRRPNQGHAVYQLVMLGDGATEPLYVVLDSESGQARRAALRLIGRFGSGRDLSRLSGVLTSVGDEGLRDAILRAMFAIDPAYGADAMAASLNADPPSSPVDMRCSLLAMDGDVRVIPHLRRHLTGTYWRSAAEALAEMGDPDGVATLVDVWDNLGEERYGPAGRAAFDALAHSGDERVVPIALDMAKHSLMTVPGPLPRKFGRLLVPYLLRAIPGAAPEHLAGINSALQAIYHAQGQAGWGGPAASHHVDLYGRALLDGRSVIEPFRQGNADTNLRTTIARALASLGPRGRDHLTQAIHTRHAGREALEALGSYNDAEALGTLAALCSDVTYPYREAALDAFASCAGLWESHAESTWLDLLADETIDAAVACLSYIARTRPTNATVLLDVLVGSADADVRKQARHLRKRYAEGVRQSPRDGLEIRIATDRDVYGYVDGIVLTVEFVNGSDRVIEIDTDLFDSPDYISPNFSLELIAPDGSRTTHPNHGNGPDRARTTAYVRDTPPAGRISTRIDIRQHCRPEQPGKYRVRLLYGHPAQFDESRLTSQRLPPVVASDMVEFHIRKPSRKHVNELIRRRLDIANLTDEDYAATLKTCRTLGELRDPRTVEALRAVAFLPRRPSRLQHADWMSNSACAALAKFEAPELVLMWIALLDSRPEIAARQLGKLGDSRAFGPLRAGAFGGGPSSGVDAAAAALVALGDETAVRVMRREALVRMDSGDEETWGQEGRRAYAMSLQVETPLDLLSHEHPGVRSYAVSIARQQGRVDVLARGLADADLRIRRRAMAFLTDALGPIDDEPREHAMRIDALKRAMADPDTEIRNAAAVGLSYQGDSSGEALLCENLTARDYKTRVAARSALARLRQRP
jgi:HEAT repeat protein